MADLIYAAKGGNYSKMCELLGANNYDVSILNHALKWAARNEWEDNAAALLRAGAEISCDNYAPVRLVAGYGYASMMKLFLQYEIDLAIMDHTVFKHAADGGYRDMMAMLIKHVRGLGESYKYAYDTENNNAYIFFNERDIPGTIQIHGISIWCQRPQALDHDFTEECITRMGSKKSAKCQ
jgi:hypothetical protein